MINLTKYEALLDTRVIVTHKEGQMFTGKWIDWTSAQDNEPDPESITIELDDGRLVEIFVSEIEKIQEA